MWYHNRLGSRCKTIWRQCVARFRLSYLRIRARVFNATEGSTVAVFGCGCVGLSCINAAKLVEASRVIAIDVNPAKEEWARKFGATEFINPRKLPEGKRIQDHLVELTDGGLDFTFDATGNVSCAHHNAS
jgi:Zn-dependent alcohol dehydrogenase